LLVDRCTLPKGINFKVAGCEIRQEIDVTISRFVTEYRAEVREDNQGHRFTATFPVALKRPVQYGNNIKAHSVYMSQFQLVPVDAFETTLLTKWVCQSARGLSATLICKPTMSRLRLSHCSILMKNIAGKSWIHIWCYPIILGHLVP
jgi:hypothetical protein